VNIQLLKKYAEGARKDFLSAVRDRISIVQNFSSSEKSKAVTSLRRELGERGRVCTIERYAYFWFNQFIGLRYMEVHGYLENYVLGHPLGGREPEILDQALEHSFDPPFEQEPVPKLSLSGNEEERYRCLLLSQCHELQKTMPMLFSEVESVAALLLPDSLLSTDSVVLKLVNAFDESMWQEGVEVIGWLYQFYISERKEKVMGSIVRSEDIPVATQLFTPKWLVKYLVQNSVGREWVASHESSSLGDRQRYLIPTGEGAWEKDKRKFVETHPEEIHILDPACGSGHILLEAYDLLKDIYTEWGYRPTEIPRLILTKKSFWI